MDLLHKKKDKWTFLTFVKVYNFFRLNKKDKKEATFPNLPENDASKEKDRWWDNIYTLQLVFQCQIFGKSNVSYTTGCITGISSKAPFKKI